MLAGLHRLAFACLPLNTTARRDGNSEQRLVRNRARARADLRVGPQVAVLRMCNGDVQRRVQLAIEPRLWMEDDAQ